MASAGPPDTGLSAPPGSSGVRKMTITEGPGSSQSMKKTIGHRGVDPTGETTYKKVSWPSDVSPDNRKGRREKLG